MCVNGFIFYSENGNNRHVAKCTSPIMMIAMSSKTSSWHPDNTSDNLSDPGWSKDSMENDISLVKCSRHEI